MDSKIKIGYLEYSTHFAGAERALYTIIANLDKDLYEPIIITPFPRKHHEQYKILNCPIIYLFDSVKWWMGRNKYKRPLRGMDFLMRVICGCKLAYILRKKSISLLHINLLRPDSLMWILPSKILGTKIAGHFRSLPLSWIPPKRVQLLCNQIICVSKIVKEHLCLTSKNPNACVIYDSIDVTLTTSLTKAQAKEKLGFSSCRILLSSVAALFPNKGHDNAIRAFSIIAKANPNVDLFIVGGGNISELHRLKSIVNEFPECKQNIYFSEKQLVNIAEVYKASDIVLSLTKEGEAFGLVPFEAALLNIPFIGPDKGAIKEFITSMREGVLVDTEDISAIIKGILWGISNREQMEIMVRRANVIVHSRLTPTIMVKNIEQVYNDILLKR